LEILGSKEVKMARVFADEVGGIVDKIDPHHAEVYIREDSKYFSSFKLAFVNAYSRATQCDIDMRTMSCPELSLEENLEIQDGFKFTFDASGAYESFWKKPTVMLANPIAIPIIEEMIVLPVTEVIGLRTTTVNFDATATDAVLRLEATKKGPKNLKEEAEEAKAKEEEAAARQEKRDAQTRRGIQDKRTVIKVLKGHITLGRRGEINIVMETQGGLRTNELKALIQQNNLSYGKRTPFTAVL
jgi:hypothetical protein